MEVWERWLAVGRAMSPYVLARNSMFIFVPFAVLYSMVSSEGVKESVNQYPFHNHVAVTPPLDQ